MFKIGEFSKIAYVSISLLRYYDEIGLFPPAAVDKQTGYRYYTIEQLPRLNRILVMRDLGLALDQIKEFLNANVSAEEIRGMLRFRQAQLQKQIRDDIVNLRGVEMRLQQVELGNHLRNFDVVLKEVPEQAFLSYRTTYDSLAAFQVDFNQFYDGGIASREAGQFVVIHHALDGGEAHGDIELGWTATNPPHQLTVADRLFTNRQLSAAPDMATIIRYGDVNVGLCLNAVGHWIAVNHAQISGPFREVYHRYDPADVTRTIIEFQVPVTVHDP